MNGLRRIGVVALLTVVSAVGCSEGTSSSTEQNGVAELPSSPAPSPPPVGDTAAPVGEPTASIGDIPIVADHTGVAAYQPLYASPTELADALTDVGYFCNPDIGQVDGAITGISCPDIDIAVWFTSPEALEQRLQERAGTLEGNDAYLALVGDNWYLEGDRAEMEAVASVFGGYLIEYRSVP